MRGSCVSLTERGGWGLMEEVGGMGLVAVGVLVVEWRGVMGPG